MATFLFDKIVFGPIKSRRLGNSLGVNILCANSKHCNYNCVYCECGWTGVQKNKLPTAQQVANELEKYFKYLTDESIKPDVITFAGNGEPTLNPQFNEIINETIRIRDIYATDVNIAVLSNATQLQNPKTVEAMNKIELPILKIDTTNQSEFELINAPVDSIRINTIIEQISSKINNPIIQTMFFKAKFDKYSFDNTKSEHLEKFFDVLKKISPKMVMIYSVDRDTPMKNIERIDIVKMQEIGNEIKKMGFNTIVTN
ncbi:radical SAM protein [Bacteroidales bacterium OttesenSCG-928-I21]|nr:radical SAM protein [Bacteroidales bacterium OttesenSCG-928-I21]